MKTIIEYECEICRKKSSDQETVIKCEIKGVQKPYPKGMIYGSSFCGNEMVFCIIKKYKEGHYYHYCTWACRDTEIGDNFGSDQYCGLDGWGRDINPPYKKSKAYKRMKKGLIDRGIKPIDYKKGIV